MPLRILHRLLVLALAAWMSTCCCEKHILADCLGDTPPAAPSGCGGSCCSSHGDPGQPRQAPEDDHGACCAEGCCTKAAPEAPWWSLSLDLIGAPLLPLLAATERDVVCSGEPMREAPATGEPPPRLALIISRRLRI